jgi:hypothetical protein
MLVANLQDRAVLSTGGQPNSPFLDEAPASATRDRWCCGRDHEEDSSFRMARTIVDVICDARGLIHPILPGDSSFDVTNETELTNALAKT